LISFGQHHVRKERPIDEAEVPLAGGAVFVHHFRTGDIRRHQIGRELDPIEIQRQRPLQRPHEQRLGQPRHTLENAVPARKQADHQLLDHMVLADDRPGNLGADRIARLTQTLKSF